MTIKEDVLKEVEEHKREKKPIIEFLLKEDKHDSGFWWHYGKQEKEKAYDVMASWVLKLLKSEREKCEKNWNELKNQLFVGGLEGHNTEIRISGVLTMMEEIEKGVVMVEKDGSA